MHVWPLPSSNSLEMAMDSPIWTGHCHFSNPTCILATVHYLDFLLQVLKTGHIGLDCGVLYHMDNKQAGGCKSFLHYRPRAQNELDEESRSEVGSEFWDFYTVTCRCRFPVAHGNLRKLTHVVSFLQSYQVGVKVVIVKLFSN